MSVLQHVRQGAGKRGWVVAYFDQGDGVYRLWSGVKWVAWLSKAKLFTDETQAKAAVKKLKAFPGVAVYDVDKVQRHMRSTTKGINWLGT